jgi:hypothetical protein
VANFSHLVTKRKVGYESCKKQFWGQKRNGPKSPSLEEKKFEIAKFRLQALACGQNIQNTHELLFLLY